MYDWLRLDLSGKPRPIHLDRAFDNLCFDRKGIAVPQQLISNQQQAAVYPNGRKVQLPTHAAHFYTADRYEFSGSLTIPTNGQCHICMLVEGTEIEIITGDTTQTYQYAETFVVPAGIPFYECRYTGPGKAFLVTAYVKDDHC
jgi:hypothetical protein